MVGHNSQPALPPLLSKFSLFADLPTEVQCTIWRFTLPITMIRVDEARCPVIELPEPSEGDLCGETPDFKDVPKYPPGIVALKVCHQSRMVALENLVPLSRPLTSPRYITCSYISTHDIIDVGFLTSLEEYRVMKDDTYGPVGNLARIKRAVGMRGWVTDVLEISQEKFLYDMASRHLSVVICPKATTDVHPQKPLLRQVFAIRSSSLEEWIFGSRITIGDVPQAIRNFSKRDPLEWENYNSATLIGGSRYNSRYKLAGLCSSPEEILIAWVWFLHKLAYAPHRLHLSRSHDSGPPGFMSIVRIFVAIMDGGQCPSCKRAILQRIKESYPQLPFDKVDILFRLNQSGVPRE
ncbi:hypothetical protein GL218_05882 [Daldinia childiae]|uniref:uncharacterized protein n=1 Tax=Daldinia childiae TaxID=326645 RepID=UPI00144704E2|nr:uncharacterized protein GL218_05882 [Daldinia childiae]KAF3058228.1 hypothetical protein GL218_05882 [Daldinia childiae]